MTPGAAIADAPLLRDGAPAWLVEQTGDVFTLLHFGEQPPPAAALRRLEFGAVLVKTLVIAPKGAAAEKGCVDVEGLAAQQFDAAHGATYLIRPDQHVCARWRTFDPAKIQAALDRATARA